MYFILCIRTGDVETEYSDLESQCWQELDQITGQLISYYKTQANIEYLPLLHSESDSDKLQTSSLEC